MKNLLKLSLIAIIAVFLFNACDKPEEETTNGSIKMKIYDARIPQNSSKSEKSSNFNSSELTTCEITFSNIELKLENGDYISILSSPKTVDLREFQGNPYDLLNIEIPLGAYSAIRISISGVSTSYQNNTYTASVTSGASLSLNNFPQTFDDTQGIINVFSNGEISFEFAMPFVLSEESQLQAVQLQFDVDASIYIVSYSFGSNTWNFAALHQFVNIGYIFEEGIQQIKHSPPYGISLVSGAEANYYGIHTFVDFAENGGTINSHTSQHVFRGSDGSLIVDAEDMAINNSALTPNTVNAVGESDIRADEVFKFFEIKSNLAAKGHELETGQTYFFSLRKTWNISTNGQEYEITRMCEPLPVIIP
ncbi:MAG: DUF4382 domain-containing protein [Bacteroidales bacterium]|nr:DUF4382 domain-containing protein [Bacteroidales bacterium]